MVCNKLILRKLYFQTNKLVNCIIFIVRITLCIYFINATILFKSKMNGAVVLRFHGDVMIWYPEGNYSVID